MSKFHNQNFISFVVSASAKDYYQAELLLLSLEHFAKHPKELILVQCDIHINKKFISYLVSNGYRYCLIESFLDQKDCVNLMQDDVILEEQSNDLLILDINLFILTPLSQPQSIITIQSRDTQPSLLAHGAQSILYYHGLVTPFGLLYKNNVSDYETLKAIDRANNLISKTRKFEFFKDYKRSCVKYPSQSQQSIEFVEKLRILISPIKRRLKLLLHAGTPKSGSTSLQFFMEKQQQELKANGILYPDLFYNVTPPKHQWLVQNLRNSDADKLLDNLEIVLNNIDVNTHTIFLSTEGIFNHWWDFPEESKSLLAELTNCFDVALWVCLRDPISFAESYYKQNIKNPRIPNINCYGNDLSFEKMLNDEWFNRHFDYLGFLYECEMLFGKSNVVSFEYNENIIQTVFSMLGLPNPVIENELRENSGLCTAATNLLRIINRYPLSPDEKQQTMPYIKKLNEILSSYSTERLIDAEDQKKLLEMTSLVNNK